MSPRGRRTTRRLASTFRPPGLGARASPGPRPRADGEHLSHGRSRNPTGDSPVRRDRRRDRRRQQARRIAGIVAGVLAVAAVALVASDLVRLGGEDKPSLAGTVQVTSDDVESPAVTTTTGARSAVRSRSTDPLRLWVGGDSLAGSLGPSLGKLAGATGVVQPYFDSRVSSGLADPGFFDWPDHATTEMAAHRPRGRRVHHRHQRLDRGVGRRGRTTYTAKVDTMMKTLDGPGRTVYWLGAPTLKDEKTDAAVVEVNAVAQEVAKRHPKVHYVDTYKLFSDTDGTFAVRPARRERQGRSRCAPATACTSRWTAPTTSPAQVYKLVDAQCGVTEQKVDGATKPTIETEGSTQVAPGATSNSGNSSGSSQLAALGGNSRRRLHPDHAAGDRAARPRHRPSTPRR